MIFLWLLAGTASALTTFQPNCSLPDAITNYVASPNTRGTTDILWTCLATIIACVYTVLHLDVPEPPKSNKWKDTLRAQTRDFFKSLKWALLTAIFPEVTATVAFGRLLSARHFLAKLKDFAPNEGWSLEHMLYADMGGFVIEYVQDDRPATWRCNSSDIAHTMGLGYLSKTPPITTAQLMDKSKSDLTGRMLASLQICYFTTGIIARLMQHISISQLEVGTCALVPYALAIYLLTLSKPKGVRTWTTLPLGEPELVEALVQHRGDSNIIDFSLVFQQERMRNSAFLASKPSMIWSLPIALSTLFGAVHIAAWNLAFPTLADQLLWRVASVVVCTALLGDALIFVLWTQIGVLRDSAFTVSLGWLMIGGLMLAYVCARTALIVEMFRGLGYLPPDCYLTTWAINIPHIG